MTRPFMSGSHHHDHAEDDASAIPFSHLSADGSATMVDVSDKPVTKRTATAEGSITTTPTVIERIRDNAMPKGAVLATARIAGIQAGKQTASLIPLCHPLPLTRIGVDFDLSQDSITAHATVTTTAKTGVEMEALTTVSVALLTIYDMIKAVDQHPVLCDIRVVEKAGGRRGDWKLPDHASSKQPIHDSEAEAHDTTQSTAWQEPNCTATIIIASTRLANKEPNYPDRAGPILTSWASTHGMANTITIVADGEAVKTAVEQALATGSDLILVAGGTGINPHDETPEMVAPLIERSLPGVMEAFRQQSHTPYAALSRGIAGVSGQSLIITLPGSPAAAHDATALLDALVPHMIVQLHGGDHDASARSATSQPPTSQPPTM